MDFLTLLTSLLSGQHIIVKGEQSSEFYETLFELEGVRNEEKGAFWEQNISMALLYNIEAILETS